MGLRSSSVVVPKHAAESFTALNLAIRVADILRGIDELIVEALVVALFVIMVHERGSRSKERTLVKENHLLEALAFDRAHKSLAVSIQIRAARRQPQGLGAAITQHRSEGVTEFAIPIHDDEPLASENTIRGGRPESLRLAL